MKHLHPLSINFVFIFIDFFVKAPKELREIQIKLNGSVYMFFFHFCCVCFIFNWKQLGNTIYNTHTLCLMNDADLSKMFCIEDFLIN